MNITRHLNLGLVLLLLIIALILTVVITSGLHSLAATAVEYANKIGIISNN